MAIEHDLSGVSLLQPQAEPVNTYVRPPDPARPTGLIDLAQSLGGLESSLDSLLASRREDQKRLDYQKGQAAFVKNNFEGYADGVRSGAIPATSSPAFMEGYKSSQGALAGTQLAERFASAYEAWPDKTSGDPAKFDAFFQNFVKDNVAGQSDPQVLASMSGIIEDVHSKFSQRFVVDGSNAVKYDYATTTAALAAKAIDVANAQGYAGALDSHDLPSTDYDSLWATLSGLRTQAVKVGADKQTTDQNLINTITLKATETGDAKLLGLLDRKVPGEDYTLAETPYGLDKKTSTENSLAVAQRVRQEEQDKADAKAEKEQRDAFTSAAQQQLAKDPSKAFDEDFLRQGSIYDPQFRTHVLEWQKTFLEAGQAKEDDAAVLEVYKNIMDGEGQDAINNALDQKVIKTGSTLASVQSFYRTYRDDSLAKQMLGSSAADGILSSIKSQTELPSVGLFPGGLSPAGIHAQTDFRIAVFKWAAAHPDADYLAQQKAMSDIADVIFKGINNPMGSGAGLGPSYETPAGLGAGATPTPQPAAPTTPTTPAAPAANPAPAPAAPTAPEPEPTPATDQGYQMWLGRLPTTMRSVLDQSFTQQYLPNHPGATPEFYYRRVYDEWLKTQHPAGPTKILNQSQLETTPTATPASFTVGSAVDNALANPEAVQRGATALLNVIAGGESPGSGYNATVGDKGVAQINLTGMTLDQAMAWQAANGGGAIGRYQFKGPTLQRVAAQLGLGGDTPFDAQTQDKLAFQLLRDRGLNDFLAGRLAPAEFATNLAKEWASLPVPGTGKSFYAGDGRNAAHVSEEDLGKALGMFPSSTVASTAGIDNLSAQPLTQGLRTAGRLDTVKGFIIHHTGGGGSVEDVVNTFRQRGFPAQYVIDRDGVIHQILPDGVAGRQIRRSPKALGLDNRNTIGVEIIAKDDSDVTPVQVEAAKRLFVVLRDKYPSLSASEVFGHGFVNPGHKEATEGFTGANAIRTAFGAQPYKVAGI